MREHISRIHHHVFMTGESGLAYMVLNVVQFGRSCTRILKMGRCNARTHFSHPPPRFYKWGECLRVYGFKSSSVQTVPHPNFENGTLQCENAFLASTTTFLWMRRVYQSICFKSSSVQTVPHPNFENGTLQCKNTFLASTTTFSWMMRVHQSMCFYK